MVASEPATTTTTATTASAACEHLDWEYLQFREATNIANWGPDRPGNRQIGVALVGLGRMGLIHLRNLLREPRARLLYCVDSDHGRLAACQKSALFKRAAIRALHCDQLEVALADREVLAVMIATPTGTHEELTRRALRAAKTVLCEKPLTPLTGSIMALYELARARRVHLLVAFQRRYDPDFRHARRLARDGSLGALQLIRITSRDCQRPPLAYVRSSGGLFHDTCIHDIDMCLWLRRALPTSVQVMGRTWREYYASDGDQCAQLSAEERALLDQVDDYFMAVVTLRFADGSLATIDNSRQAGYGYDQRCELYGSRATYRCDGRRPLAGTLASGSGELAAPLKCSFASRYSSAYAHELQDLLTLAELAAAGAGGKAGEPDQLDDNNNNNELTMDEARDDHQQHHLLMEPVRPTLVVAAHTIADACAEASRTGHTFDLSWPEAFERQFKLEIELETEIELEQRH